MKSGSSFRAVEAPGFAGRAASRRCFKKLFDAVLAALMAADRDVHPKAGVKRLLHFASDQGVLRIRPCRKVMIVRAGRLRHRTLPTLRASRLSQRLSDPFTSTSPHAGVPAHRQALDPGLVVLVRYHDTEFPLDEFFRRQVGRVGLANEGPPLTDTWFAGHVDQLVRRAARDDRLSRSPVWTGRLTLAGGETQIECVFDKAIGEDALNPFGNKEVSITGRAIFTGDSQLPERVEAMAVEERRRATAAIDDTRALGSGSSDRRFGRWA